MSYTRKAFSLIELLVALSILAIILALLVPNTTKLFRTSHVRVAEDQAATIQTAVNSWCNGSGQEGSNSSVQHNTGTFSMGGPSTTDMVHDTFYSTQNHVSNYLSSSTLYLSDGSPNLVFTTTATATYLDTDVMRKLKGTVFANVNVLIGNTIYPVSPVPGVNHAHMRIYWPNNLTVRQQSNPAVVLFIPTS